MSVKRNKGGDAVTYMLLTTFRLNGNFLGAADRISAPSNLTGARWQVLGSIMQEGKTVSQIAREMGLTRQSVQRLANVLVEVGMVEFVDNPAHARAKLVTATEMGRSAMYSLSERQHIWANSVADGFSTDELNTAVEVMRAVSKRLEKQSLE